MILIVSLFLIPLKSSDVVLINIINSIVVITMIQEVWTPLHCASANGYDDLVSLLLERGSLVDAEDEVSGT